MRIFLAFVGVVVGLGGGALGAEWSTSRGEFCLNRCTMMNNFYWCYTVDPKGISRMYKPTGHPDFFQHRDGLLVDLNERWDYCTPQDFPSSQTSLWPITPCSDKCSTIGGRSICSTSTTKQFKGFPKESVTLSSAEDVGAGKYQKQIIGTYMKTNLTGNVEGYPVYELDHKVNNKSQYLYAYADNTWRVGPNYRSVKGSALRSSKVTFQVEHSPTPNKDGWMFQKNGRWVNDPSMDATFNIGARGGTENHIQFNTNSSMVNISSTGNVNEKQKKLMATYTQLDRLINGYPVYRQTEQIGNQSQYLFVHYNNWYVGPNEYSDKGAVLLNTNAKGPTPPRKNWLFRGGQNFVLDDGITARMEMEAKDWFYCSEQKDFKREQISAVEKLWCIGDCTRTDGSDFTCPTMFGRDKCSPNAGQNVKGEACQSECLPDGDSYKCYMDKQFIKSELCGKYFSEQSLEFTHGGNICAGLCEFPNAEEKEFKECKIASWKSNDLGSELKESVEVCWGSRPWDTTTTIMAGCIVAVVVVLCCCCCFLGVKRSGKWSTREIRTHHANKTRVNNTVTEQKNSTYSFTNTSTHT